MTHLDNNLRVEAVNPSRASAMNFRRKLNTSACYMLALCFSSVTFTLIGFYVFWPINHTPTFDEADLYPEGAGLFDVRHFQVLYMDDPRLGWLVSTTIKRYNITNIADADDIPISEPVNEVAKYLESAVEYKMNGFYIEVGTGDGRNLSATYNMEKRLDWDGLSIDCDMEVARMIPFDQRNLLFSPTCVGTLKYSHKCLFGIRRDHQGSLVKPETEELNTVRTMNCYPLYSYINALKIVKLDLLVLDIGGSELEILKTLPYSFHISVIAVRFTSNDLIPPFTQHALFRNYTVYYKSSLMSTVIYTKNNLKEA